MSVKRVIFYLIVAGLAVAGFGTALQREQVNAPVLDSVALGRQVYISEGCIHCHSQFVRPVGADVMLWGDRKSVV